MGWRDEIERKLDGALDDLKEEIGERLEQASASLLGNNHAALGGGDIKLTVDGLPLEPHALHAEASLSHIDEFRFYCAVAVGVDADGFLGKPALWSCTSADGLSHDYAGQVTRISQGRILPDGREEWIVTATSGLATLGQCSRYRIIHRRTVIELAEELLQGYGLAVDNLTREDYSVLDWTAQVGETDLQFLQRLLARHGIWFYSTAGEQGETIILADDPHGASRADRGELAVTVEIGGNRSVAGNATVALRQSRRMYRWQPDRSQVHQQVCPSESTPVTQESQSSTGKSVTQQTWFQHGSSDAGDCRRKARLAQERQQCRASTILVSGAVGDLQVGQWLPVAGHGPCLITRASLTFSSPRNHQGNSPSGFTWEAALLPMAQPFRPALPAAIAMPLVFPARIEADTGYSQLDGQARRKARIGFDGSDQPLSESSPPLRQLQPHGSLPGKDGQPTGWDWPLRNGAEVLLTCLNNDPDKPLVLGYVSAASQPGPATNRNAPEHRLLTPAGHLLNLNDRKDAQAITLHTPDGQCLLELNANSESPLVTLACEQGALVMRAGQQQNIKVGKTSQAQVGNDSTTQVQNSSVTHTDSGVIHHQSHTNTHLAASRHAKLKSGKNLELYSAANSQLRVQGSATITAKKGLAHKVGGNLHLQAADAIDIRGDGSGDLTLHQSGGGITIKKDGTIRLFGNTVTLKGQSGVTFNGNKEYGVPAGVKGDSPVPMAALASAAIPELDLPSQSPAQVKTLNVLPLRHGVFASPDTQAMQAVPSIPAHVPAPVDLQHAKASIETLRAGYLSVLVDRQGERSWQCYRCHADSSLERLDSLATGTPVPSVVLDKPNTISNTWWLFSPDPLTDAKRQDYEDNADAYAEQGKWQTFTPQAWLQGQRSLPSTLSSKQLRGHLLEARLEDSLALQQALAEQFFAPTWLSAGQGPVWNAANLGSGLHTLNCTLQRLEQDRGAALVLDDALGIAQSLNAWRNGALDSTQAWLAEEDEQGVSNDWKVQIQQQIDKLHQGYAGKKAAGFMSREESTWDTRTQTALAALEYEEEQKRRLYGDDNFEALFAEEFALRRKAIQQQQQGWLEHQSTRQYSPEQQAAYQKEFEQDYLSRLDTGQMNQVQTAFIQHNRKAEQEMERRAPDQIAVLQSDYLQNALHAYDKDNVDSGARFTAALGQAIDGLIGCQSGRDLLDGWWAVGPQSDPANLCWRAVAYNQQALEDNLTEMAQVLENETSSEPDWPTIGATQAVQAATGHFEKLDTAIGSLERHGVSVSGVLAWQAGLFRNLFGSGHPTKGEKALYRLLGTVSRAQLGRYGFDARMNALLASGSNANPNRVRGQINRYSRQSLDDFITQPKASEVRYGRTLSVLIVLEAVMLLVKAETTEDKGSRFYLEAMAGVMAGAACGAEMLASAAEAAAKRAGPATADGARILQGNRKLWATSLGTVGGVVLAIYDFRDSGDAAQRSKDLKGDVFALAYFSRGLAGLGLAGSSSLLAIATARPFFEHVARISTNRIAGLFAEAFAGLSIKLGTKSAQVWLTRLLMGSNVVFWVATGAWYLVAPDALEAWCDKSVFRKNGANGYEDLGAELSQLWQSVAEVT